MPKVVQGPTGVGSVFKLPDPVQVNAISKPSLWRESLGNQNVGVVGHHSLSEHLKPAPLLAFPQQSHEPFFCTGHHAGDRGRTTPNLDDFSRGDICRQVADEPVEMGIERQHVQAADECVSRTRRLSGARNRELLSSGTKSDRVDAARRIRRDHCQAQRDGITLIGDLTG